MRNNGCIAQQKRTSATLPHPSINRTEPGGLHPIPDARSPRPRRSDSADHSRYGTADTLRYDSQAVAAARVAVPGFRMQTDRLTFSRWLAGDFS